MEYKIAHERNVEKLEYVVAELISVGWEPLGGVSFNEGWGCTGQYTQAMIRLKKS
jgi:hypothetical protein